MNEPLFGKQKSDNTENQNTDGSNQPSMDFGSQEAQTPMPPAHNPIASTLPAGDALIKPFENTPETILSPIAPAAPAPKIRTEEIETNDPNVRKISSATFRRLDEPVETTSVETTSSISHNPIVAPIEEPVMPAKTVEPVITAEAPTFTPAVEPIMSAEPIAAIAPIAPVFEAAPVTPEPVAPEPVAMLSDSPALQEPIAPIVETPVIETPEVEMLMEEAPAIHAPAIEPTLEAAIEIDGLDDDDEISADIYDALEEANTPTASAEEMAEVGMPAMQAGELAGMGNTTVEVDEAAVKLLISEHQQWLDSAGAEGRRAVFRDNLSGMDFSQQRLSGASFRGLNLERCKFTQTQLNEADFGDCQLTGADFTAANLDSAIMTHVMANDVAFSAAQMNKVDFGDSQAQGADFTQAKMSEANFRDSNLSGAKLQNATAHLINFRGANLDQSNLNHGDFSQATFREANLNGAILEAANLTQASFKDTQLNRVDLNSADFSQALDISTDVQAQFMQVERAKLHNEVQKLDHIRDELEQRERALISEREQLQRQLHAERTKAPAQGSAIDTGEIATKLAKGSRLFLFFGIGWALLSFLLAIIMQNVISQLESGDLSLIEILLMGILMLMPLFLFVVSMSKAFSLSYALRKLVPRDPNEPQ